MISSSLFIVEGRYLGFFSVNYLLKTRNMLLSKSVSCDIFIIPSDWFLRYFQTLVRKYYLISIPVSEIIFLIEQNRVFISAGCLHNFAREN